MPGGASLAVYADWQSAADYVPLLKMDRAGLAWEWLRRSADYRGFWYCDTSQPVMRHSNPALRPLNPLNQFLR
jgi:hypothetical protein